MLSDLDLPSYSSTSSPTDYFSIVPSPSTPFSVETPSLSPLSNYSSDIFPDPANPLLAFREVSPYQQTASSMDASEVLQLQTAAAHSRPTATPMQHSTSTSSNSSASSMGSNSPSPPMLCCARCRRSSAGHSGMVRFGTNLYYCSHCASMVGYSPG
ncbi:hypothetical protein BDV96DRAFT_584434 [Lophiotrema nucula]|uniref:Uncharacterized protein n=1 Tax=Lophiotrema nucula TaxID=690887 RepID=A0A6A5YT11_9PLEO|nr:hypothetical protein BDV96DRAFT_584434 [Lophiotrema nucula]